MKILFLDIETAPHNAYIWSCFTKYISPDHIEKPGYTLCFAAKWGGEKEIIFYSVWQHGLEKMIQAAHDLLGEADAVIHYNGKKFDIPMLQQEFLLQGIPPPAPYEQIDLFHTVKREFRFPSNKLDYVCKRLRLGKKVNHKGMELWTEVMEGDEKSQRTMQRYNEQDVKLLPRLYKKLLPYIKSHPNCGLYTDMEQPVCINCGSKRLQNRGFAYTKTQRYRRYQCLDCGKWNRSRRTNLAADARANILVGAA